MYPLQRKKGEGEGEGGEREITNNARYHCMRFLHTTIERGPPSWTSARVYQEILCCLLNPPKIFALLIRKGSFCT